MFTCFWWSEQPIEVIDYFQSPRSVRQAEAFLKRADLPAGSVGGHRIRPGHKGAKDALVSACSKHKEFRQILTGDLDGFDVRFRATRHLTGVRSWGRTTCFDLILRAGSLGLGGHKYSPELAYLAEATGPAHGFEIIFGKDPRTDPSASEKLLHEWTASWDEIVQAVDVEWTGPAYDSGDFENALCIYQEQPNPGAC